MQPASGHAIADGIERRPGFRRRRRWGIVAALLAVAAGVRLVGLTAAPPGINHDEASNGYDALCLLETGADRWGHAWPVVLEGFGRADWRGALYCYLIVPFHALFGAGEDANGVLATRLPAALVGIGAVWLLYLLGARLFNRRVGLWACLFMAVGPWPVALSRMGHESTLTPALLVFGVLLGAAAFDRRSVPGANKAGSDEPAKGDVPMPRRVLLCFSAGVFALSLYAYPSTRLLAPLLVLAAAMIYRQGLFRLLKSRVHRRSLIPALVVGMVVALPMIKLTVFDADKVLARARQVSVFHQPDPLATNLARFAGQYLAHFAPDWLVRTGERYFVLWPGRLGQLNPVCAVLFYVGLVVLIGRARKQKAARLILAWILISPLPAALTIDAPHMFRSATAVPAMLLAAAVAAEHLTSLVDRRMPRTYALSAIAFLVAVHALGAARALDRYFVHWAKRPDVRARYQQDLCEAVRLIRPIWRDYDRVFVSDQRSREKHWFSGEAYCVVALTLPIPPSAFQSWSKTVFYERPSDGFHRVESAGPFTFTTRTDVLAAAFSAEPGLRALMIARPGEIGGGRIIGRVSGESDGAAFEIIDVVPTVK